MFKRDENGLSMAKRDNARYVCASLETGKILGYFSYAMNGRWLDKDLAKTDIFLIEEYEWFTDETRETKVTTAADLYDKTEWTHKGFKIDGKRYPIK